MDYQRNGMADYRTFKEAVVGEYRERIPELAKFDVSSSGTPEGNDGAGGINGKFSSSGPNTLVVVPNEDMLEDLN